MYRHELRFVLRFGSTREFHQLAAQLHAEEVDRGWTPPRVWQSISGTVNEIVIEHDYVDAEAFRSERAEFHDEPGRVGEVLAGIAELAVPGTAEQFDRDGVLDAGVT
ncbi:MAG TPA: hypothetical protein VFU33_01285 [Gaiellaceae bacterium]|nr:hypothetical protein [Gaiellaceae bacterium]